MVWASAGTRSRRLRPRRAVHHRRRRAFFCTATPRVRSAGTACRLGGCRCSTTCRLRARALRAEGVVPGRSPARVGHYRVRSAVGALRVPAGVRCRSRRRAVGCRRRARDEARERHERKGNHALHRKWGRVISQGWGCSRSVGTAMQRAARGREWLSSLPLRRIRPGCVPRRGSSARDVTFASPTSSRGRASLGHRPPSVALSGTPPSAPSCHQVIEIARPDFRRRAAI